MATLIACASASLNAAATWRTIDAIAGSQNFSGTAAVALTTTPGTGTDSPTWTGDFSVVDGILLQLAAMGGTTGTLTVILRRTSGTPADLATVTLDLSQLPTSADGWILAKFGSSVTLAAGSTYTVRVYRSVGASTLSLYATAATTSWNRCLRTTSNPGAAPVAADVLFISGEFTGAGAPTALSVAVDFNLTTAYGAIHVSVGGTLAYAFSASSTYRLRVGGNLTVYGGGTLTMGTTGSPMPASSTATLEFDCASSGQYGLLGHGTFTAQGATRTYDRVKLAADVAAGATSMTTDVSHGWTTGEEIGIAGTRRAGNEAEKRTLSSASGTSLGVAALTYPHHGTSPTQATIILLTRNVRITAVNTAYVTFFHPMRYSTVDFDWVQVSWIGENVTGKRGVEIDTIEGSFSFNRCAIHDAEDFGLYLGTAATSNHISLTNCVTFALAKIAGPAVTNVATSGTDITKTGNVFMMTVNAIDHVSLYDLGGAFSNNEITGGGRGLYMRATTMTPGTFSGIEVHSTSLDGMAFYTGTIRNFTISDLTIWRCGASGIALNAHVTNLLFDGLTLFGNTTQNIAAFGAAVGSSSRVRAIDAVLAGDASYATTYGISFASAVLAEKWEFLASDFGVAAGAGNNARVAHATADIYVGSSSASQPFVDLLLARCRLSSATKVAGAQYLGAGSAIRAQQLDQVAGNHQTWTYSGTIEEEGTIYKTAAPSAKLTPSSASRKLETEAREVAVKKDTFITVSVWVRKSAAYAGAAPRLVLKRNDAAGVTADAVIDTHTAAADDWEQLSGVSPLIASDDAVLEVAVDCDGTAGEVFVDDWEVI